MATKNHGGCMESIWMMVGISRLLLGPFLGALVLILGQNLRLTREWFVIQDRPLHHRVSRKIFLKNEALLRKSYIRRKWVKIILL